MKMDVGLAVALPLLLVLLAQRADLGTVVPLTTLEEVSTWAEEFTTSSSDVESAEGGVTVLPGKSSFILDRVTPSLEPRAEHGNFISATKPPANPQLGAFSEAEPKTGWVSASTAVVTKADFGTEQVTSAAATKTPESPQLEDSSEANPSTQLALASTAISTGTEAVNATGGPSHLSAEKSASPTITTPQHAPDHATVFSDSTVLLTSPSATIDPFRRLTSSSDLSDVLKNPSAATTTPSGSSSTRDDTVTNVSTRGSGDKTVTSTVMAGKPDPNVNATDSPSKPNHWYIIIAVVLLALLVLVACFVASIRRKKKSGSTSFQNPSKKKKKGGEDAWAGPVQMPDENGMPVDVVDDDKDPSGKRLTLTTFFGKRKSRQCSVLLEEVTVPSENPDIEGTEPLLSQGANGQVNAGAVSAPGNKDGPPTAQEPKPTSAEKEASTPPASNGQNSAMQVPPQANTMDPGDLPPPPSPPPQTDLSPPPLEAHEPSSAV